MSQSSLQLELLLDDVNDTDMDNITSTELSKYYSWLTILLTYLPMWTRSKIECIKKRKINSHLFHIAISFTILITISRLILHAYLRMPASPNLAAKTAHVLYEIVLAISRLLSIYYFYSIFDYNLWISFKPKKHDHIQKYDNLGGNTTVNSIITKIIPKYNLFLKISLLLIFATETFMVLARDNSYEPKWSKTWWIISAIDIPLSLYFVFYPMYICVMIVSSIFIKYHCHLQYLIYLLENDSDDENAEVDFKYMFELYERIKMTFSREYHKSFEICVLIYLGELILDGWITSYEVLNNSSTYDPEVELVNADIIWLIGDIITVAVFVVTSSLVTEGFELFQTYLVDYGKKFMVVNNDENPHQRDNDDQRWHYNYLVVYIMKNPLVVTVGDIYITKVNAVKFTIGFIIARCLAYSVNFLHRDD